MLPSKTWTALLGGSIAFAAIAVWMAVRVPSGTGTDEKPSPPTLGAVAAPAGPVALTLSSPRSRTKLGQDMYGRTPTVTEFATVCPTQNVPAPCAVYDFGGFSITHNGSSPCVRPGSKAGAFATACDDKAVDTANSLMPGTWDAGQ